MQQLLLALFTIIVGVGAAILYFYAVNWLLDLALPPRGPAAVAARNQQIAAMIRPWLFLGPAPPVPRPLSRLPGHRFHPAQPLQPHRRGVRRRLELRLGVP